MTRKYLVFGSDDGRNWELYDTIEAGGHAQALNKGREKESHRLYAAVPERNWAEGEPEVVERPPVVKWKMKNGEQLTVDDVVEEKPKETAKKELVEEAKEALSADLSETTQTTL